MFQPPAELASGISGGAFRDAGFAVLRYMGRDRLPSRQRPVGAGVGLCHGVGRRGNGILGVSSDRLQRVERQKDAGVDAAAEHREAGERNAGNTGGNAAEGLSPSPSRPSYGGRLLVLSAEAGLLQLPQELSQDRWIPV